MIREFASVAFNTLFGSKPPPVPPQTIPHWAIEMANAQQSYARQDMEYQIFQQKRAIAISRLEQEGFRRWDENPYLSNATGRPVPRFRPPQTYDWVLCARLTADGWDGSTHEVQPFLISPTMNVNDLYWKPLPKVNDRPVAPVDDGIIDAEFEVLDPKQITSD